MSRKALVLALVCACASLLAAARAGAQTAYTDSQRHWSCTLPKGWSRMPQAQVDFSNRQMQRAMGRSAFSTNYIVGFIEGEMQTPGSPYVLVQQTVMPMEGQSYDDIEEGLAGVKNGVEQASGAMKGIASGLKAGVPRVDRERNRMYLSTEITVIGIGKMKGLSIGFFGKEGFIQLNCFAGVDDFDAAIPTFEALADSFAYDEGYVFVPGSSKWSRIGLMAAVGAAIGGLSGLGKYLKNRKAKAVA